MIVNYVLFKKILSSTHAYVKMIQYGYMNQLTLALLAVGRDLTFESCSPIDHKIMGWKDTKKTHRQIEVYQFRNKQNYFP